MISYLKGSTSLIIDRSTSISIKEIENRLKQSIIEQYNIGVDIVIVNLKISIHQFSPQGLYEFDIDWEITTA